MNRLESRTRTREELERYISLLVAKLESTGYRSEMLIDRIDGIAGRLERLDRREAAPASRAGLAPLG